MTEDLVFLYKSKCRKKFSIFGADMSSSVHNDNTNKDILILGEGLTQQLDDTTLTTEGLYPVNCTLPN